VNSIIFRAPPVRATLHRVLLSPPVRRLTLLSSGCLPKKCFPPLFLPEISFLLFWISGDSSNYCCVQFGFFFSPPRLSPYLLCFSFRPVIVHSRLLSLVFPTCAISLLGLFHFSLIVISFLLFPTSSPARAMAEQFDPDGTAPMNSTPPPPETAAPSPPRSPPNFSSGVYTASSSGMAGQNYCARYVTESLPPLETIIPPPQ